MKKMTVFVSLLILSSTLALEGQTTNYKVRKEVDEYGNSFNKDLAKRIAVEDTAKFERFNEPSKAWWHESSLGLMMHWGIYSLMEQNPSWSMTKHGRTGELPKFPPEKYYSYAKVFDPQFYEPEKWLKVAKEAGFNYAVMTTKHHDGYAIWPSKYGEMNSGRFLNGRDLLRPYVNGCRKVGMRVGLYFSGVDWFHKDFPRQSDRITKKGFDFIGSDGVDYSNWRRWDDKDPKEVEKHLNNFYDYAKGQLRELLTNYGKIDILWFDGFPVGWPSCLKNQKELVKKRLKDIDKMIHELQPDIMINNRGEHITFDFVPAERSDGSFVHENHGPLKPEHKLHKRWEYCSVWDGGWGWRAESKYRTSAWVLWQLAKSRAGGGNFLLNSSPTNNGKQPRLFYERCEELKQWMSHSKISLIGAECLADRWENHIDVIAPITTVGNTWYLHIIPFYNKSTFVANVKAIPAMPKSVKLLRTGESVKWVKTETGISIKHAMSFESRSKQALDEVIAIEWDN